MDPDGIVGPGVLWIILVVCLLGALAGAGMVIGDTTSTTDVDPAGSVDGAAATPAAFDSLPDEDEPKTLEGDVTTELESVDDRILVGTERGLYVYENDSVETFVPTRSVRDVTHVEGDTAVVLVDDDHFPNVLGVDIDDGEVRWSESHERETYSNDFGYVDRKLPAFDAEPMSDGSGDVAVSVGNAVLAVDGETGDRRWTAEYDHAVWNLATSDTHVHGGTQGGTLATFDADDGEHVASESLAESYEHDSDGEIPRSVWDVEVVTVDGADRVAATTEDGTAAVVDPDDRTVVWQEQLVEFDDDELESYYRGGDERSGEPTLPGDGAYFNLELTVVDANDPGIAVDVAVDERDGIRQYREDVAELHYLDAATGSVEWSTEDVPVTEAGTITHSPDVADGSLLVPAVPAEESQEIVAIGLDDGQERETLDVSTVSDTEFHQRSGPGASIQQGYVVPVGDTLAVTATSGDLIGVDDTGSIQWSVPSVQDVEVVTADFTDDGTDDYLFASQNARERGSVQTRSLVLRSGTDGSVVWAQDVDLDAYHELGGLADVQPVETSDGVHVVGLQRSPPPDRGGESTEGSTIVVLSGTDGEIRNTYQFEDDRGGQVQLLSTEHVGDVTGNGNPNLIVAESGGVNVFDVETGDIVWDASYRDHGSGGEEWRPIDDANRINYRSVGDDAMLAFSQGTEEMALVEPAADGSLETRSQFDFGGEPASGQLQLLGDLTGDGYEEVLVERRDDGDHGYAVVAPADGDVVETFDDTRRLTVRPVDADFTGDGTPGMIAYEQAGENDLYVYDGTDRIWTKDLDRPVGDADLPAAPVGDVTGDGTDDVAVVESSRIQGAWVDLYDPETGSQLESITLEHRPEDDHRDPGPGVHAQQIPDQTGDGTPELGVVAVTDGAATVEYTVVDPQAGERLVGGDGDKRTFVDLEDRVGMVRSDAGIRTADVTAGVSIDAPDDGSELDLEWSYDDDADYVSIVLVDDRPVAITDDDAATLRLPAGDHEITVQSMRADGLTVYDTVTTSVDSTSSMDLVLYAATAVSVAILFAIGLVPKLLARRRDPL